MSEDSATAQDFLNYDPETGTYRAEYRDGIEPPSRAVTRAIAAITGKDQLDLDPIHLAVDPEALDTLFLSTRRGGHRGDGEVSFPYCGFQVAVRSHGTIEIRPIEAAE